MTLARGAASVLLSHKKSIPTDPRIFVILVLASAMSNSRSPHAQVSMASQEMLPDLHLALVKTMLAFVQDQLTTRDRE